MKKKGQIDFYFMIAVFALLAFGLIILMSASSEYARSQSFTGGDAYYFIKRQAIWAILSVCAMFFFANFDYHRLVKLSGIAYITTIALLVLVLIVGSEANGGKRWLDLKFIQFQPSEIAKIAIILFLANTLTQNKKYLKTFKRGLLPNLLAILLVAALLIVEPHLSVTIIIVLVGIIMLFVGGVEWKQLVLLSIPVLVTGVGLIFSADYRRKRFFSFLDPFKYPLEEGYQVIQSLYAIGSGGLFGLGLGQSRQKYLYLPEPQNDFIFAIWCEEMGFIGALIVILVFAFLIYRGIKISLTAKDKEGSLIAMGISSLVALEVIMNLAVISSAMPVTGIPLPFFSYGGTALLSIMSCMGIMLNISKQCST